jgi:hypothetical protein
MTDSDPSSILSPIRERAQNVRTAPALSKARDWACINSAADVPRLLAAVEAALDLHQPVDRGTGAQCKGCATHVTFTRWPCPTVAAITAALTGKETGDGG